MLSRTLAHAAQAKKNGGALSSTTVSIIFFRFLKAS
jgi:hypothetical protein